MEDDLTEPVEQPSAFIAPVRPRRITDEDGWLNLVDDELDQLKPPHEMTKRRTVIALVQAKLTRTSEERVWELSDTCSRNTWHRTDKNKKGDRRGWKWDPVISRVYDRVLKLALQWIERKPLLAVQEAAAILTNAAPEAAEKVVTLMRGAMNQRDQLQAGLSILDRAGVETAPKGSMDVKQKSLNLHAQIGPQDFDINAEELNEEEFDVLVQNLLLASGRGHLLIQQGDEWDEDEEGVDEGETGHSEWVGG